MPFTNAMAWSRNVLWLQTNLPISQLNVLKLTVSMISKVCLRPRQIPATFHSHPLFCWWYSKSQRYRKCMSILFALDLVQQFSTLGKVIFWLYEHSLWPWPSAWQSSLWWCIVMPGLLAKRSAIQKIPSGQTFTEIFTIAVTLTLSTAIQWFRKTIWLKLTYRQLFSVKISAVQKI